MTSTPTPPIALAPTTTVAQVAEVFARLHAASRRTPTATAEQRRADLARLEEVILARKDDLAAAVSRDFGNRSRHETMASEIYVVLQELKHAASHLATWMKTESRSVAMTFKPAKAEVVWQPVGVVGVIGPWNYPIQLVLSPLVGALAAGNRVLLKPSELTPETAALIVAMIADTFDAEQVAVVTGGHDVAAAVSALPLDHLIFTGSTRVGKIVMRAAAENLVPVTLELGGKSPAIVGHEASMSAAATKIMSGKCFNAGQTCVAPDYALVPTNKLHDFLAACQTAVGDYYPALADNRDYTTIVNAAHYDRLRGYLDEARRRGVRMIELNPANEIIDPASRKLAPVLLVDPPEDLAVMQEEIFGPLLPIRTYDTLDQAIAYVNDRPRPLALYYFGHDAGEIEAVTQRTVAGGMCINETMMHVAISDLPFGGIGPSGMGHYHGREGFETFSKAKAVFTQARVSGANLVHPPYGIASDILLKLLVR